MKYNFIDSLRGIAILMVILLHTFQTLPLPDSYLSYTIRYSQMGVQLFFIASAYTLCLSFDKRWGENHLLINFYIRRFFRIAPAYYLGIIGYLLFRTMVESIKSGDLSIPIQYTLTNITANFFLIHGLYEPANNTIVPGGWSIGTEVLFYIVFPAVFIAVSKHLNSKILIVAFPITLFLLLLLFIDLSGYLVPNNRFIYFSLLNQAPVFAVGISIYLLHKHYNSSIENISNRLLITFLFITTFSAIYIGWASPVSNSFVYIPFISALSFAALLELFKRHDFLNIKILRRIGQRSYSMYLIHFIFAQQVSRALSQQYLIDPLGKEISLIIIYIMTVVLSYYLSKLSYIYIEKRFIKKGHKLIAYISNRSVQHTEKIPSKEII